MKAFGLNFQGLKSKFTKNLFNPKKNYNKYCVYAKRKPI